MFTVLPHKLHTSTVQPPPLPMPLPSPEHLNFIGIAMVFWCFQRLFANMLRSSEYKTVLAAQSDLLKNQSRLLAHQNKVLARLAETVDRLRDAVKELK